METRLFLIGIGIVTIIYIIYKIVTYRNEDIKGINTEISEILTKDEYKVKGQYE